MMIKQVESKPTGISFGTQKFNKAKNEHKATDPKVNKKVSNYDIIRAKVTEKTEATSSQHKEKINIGL